MEFKKNRVVSGDQFLLANLEFQYDKGKWEFEDSKSKTKTLILKMLDEGVKNKDIATELGVSPAYVSKIKRENGG